MIIFPAFSSLPLCCFNTHSRQPWELREWQMAARKVWDSRKSAEMLLYWQRRKRRNKNRTWACLLASGLHQVPGNLFTLKYEEIPHGTICIVGLGGMFFFLCFVLNPFIWIWAVTVWKFPRMGLRRSWVQNLERNRKTLAFTLNCTSRVYSFKKTKILLYQNVSISRRRRRTTTAKQKQSDGQVGSFPPTKCITRIENQQKMVSAFIVLAVTKTKWLNGQFTSFEA